jgi:hypothetical protein
MSLANNISNIVEGKYKEVFTPNGLNIMYAIHIGKTIVYKDNSNSMDVFINRVIGQDINLKINTLLVIGGNSSNNSDIEAVKISELFEDYGIILYGAFGKSIMHKFGLKAIYVDNVKNAAVLTRKLYYKRIIFTPIHQSSQYTNEVREFVNILRYY